MAKKSKSYEYTELISKNSPWNPRSATLECPPNMDRPPFSVMFREQQGAKVKLVTFVLNEDDYKLEYGSDG